MVVLLVAATVGPVVGPAVVAPATVFTTVWVGFEMSRGAVLMMEFAGPKELVAEKGKEISAMRV